MREHDESEFEDPRLKQAVRHARGREPAPPSLRAKVSSGRAAAAAAASGVTETASTSSAKVASRGRRLVVDRSFWRASAAAAFLLAAIGFAAYSVRENLFPSSPFSTGSAAVIPATIVQDMVKTHDACAKLPDHHLIPGDNPEALRDKLTVQGGVTASATTLNGGWKFRGAGICKVGERSAVHLLWVREEDYVSIFSVSAPEGCGYGTAPYDDVVDNHPVAGFTQGGGLYCVVGSCDKGEFTKSELNEVLTQVQASVAVGCMTHETLAAAATAAGATSHQH